MKKLFVGLLALGALGLASCGDDNGPTVEITSPANGTSYAAGDTIFVEGTAMDDVEVTGLNVQGNEGFDLSGSLDLSGVSDRSDFPFGFSVTIDGGSQAGDYSLTVTATDADGNSDDDSLEFSIQ